MGKPRLTSTSALAAFNVFKKNKGVTKKNKKKRNTCTPIKIVNNGTPAKASVKKMRRESRSAIATPVANGSAKENDNSIPCGNEDSEKCFSWLINPVLPADFLSETWEKKPLVLQRRGEKYFNNLFTCAEFDKILRNNHLEYNTNIDVVRYVNGERQTLEADGRAYAAVIWDHFQNGNSIRLLNPQTYSKPIWKLCSLLQEYFGSFVGANMYLTPPGSQGFAPHYDDIEAFVLQFEGKKHWKIYPPRNSTEELPRTSSKNFTEGEIGKPMMEVELSPGDLLYFPRGYIHQAKTLGDEHSLHITLSTNQKNTWGDLLQIILPQAIESAMKESVAYRESLPKDYMSFVGTANTDSESPERKAFIEKLFHLTRGLTKHILADTGSDVMAKSFIHCSHPPCLTQGEKSTSIHGNGERWENGAVRNSVELKPDSEIRFIRKRAVRLVREDCQLRLYHTFENGRVYQEREPQYIVIDWKLSPGVEMLLKSCPDFMTVESLPLEDLEDQMNLASLLYDKGLIQTKVPLQDSENESDDDSYENGDKCRL